MDIRHGCHSDRLGAEHLQGSPTQIGVERYRLSLTSLWNSARTTETSGPDSSADMQHPSLVLPMSAFPVGVSSWAMYPKFRKTDTSCLPRNGPQPEGLFHQNIY